MCLWVCSWCKTFWLSFSWPTRRGVGPSWRCNSSESWTCTVGNRYGEVIWAYLLLRHVSVRPGCLGLWPFKFWLSSLSLSCHAKWCLGALLWICSTVPTSGLHWGTEIGFHSHKWNLIAEPVTQHLKTHIFPLPPRCNNSQIWGLNSVIYM